MEATAKSDPPLVSIVIPTYNYGHFVSDAIESALAQTHRNIEVILVDDGSIDHTPEVAQSYGSRIRYVRKANGGLSDSRNVGTHESLGEFIVFLDADDLLKQQMVERSLSVLLSLPPEYALVGHIPDRIDENKSPISTPSPHSRVSGELSTLDLVLKNRIPATVLVRRAALIETGLFDVSLPASEDRDMWIRLSTRHRLWFQAEVLSSVRRHGTNMSLVWKRQSAAIRSVLHKAERAGCLRGPKRFLWIKVWSFYWYQIAMMQGANDPNARGQALWNLLRSTLLWPAFPDYRRLDEKFMFRLRLAIWILRGARP